ncbi:hypothetical protein [Streptomyces alboflavus]|uniref:hypothetical protein n=1 Tax=Streptomyces alboflavus TaxID=67267 RepID=UPI0036C239E9
MTDTLPPQRTLDDVTALADFITARVKPLRDAVLSDTDEFRAFQALLELVAFTSGVASGVSEEGRSPNVQFFCLRATAQRWADHPDFLPTWK